MPPSGLTATCGVEFVGSENVRDLNGLATRLPEGAELFILPAVSGG